MVMARVIACSKLVAVRSFRLWKLKAGNATIGIVYPSCCSSFVPIVETESCFKNCQYFFWQNVAVRSFRLWKLKARIDALKIISPYCCSSFVPIVETESWRAAFLFGFPKVVAVRSFRLWKLKELRGNITCMHCNMLQFVRSDCGN